MAWVYILQGKTNGRFYVGSTSDLQRRLEQHAAGHTQTTDRMGPTDLVLSQKYPSLKEARTIERKIKKLKRRDYIERMVRDGKINMQIPPRRPDSI
ncbi:MAG: GIY-YIG nuclease family protein [Patescibacteria group bacterium]